MNNLVLLSKKDHDQYHSMAVRTYDLTIKKGINGKQRKIIHDIVWGFIAGLIFIGFMVLITSIVNSI
jgi:hypothetical protein